MAQAKTRGKPPAKETPEADSSPEDYEAFLDDLKERTRTAQLRAAVAANHEMIGLYRQIGRDIVERRKLHGWGKSVVERPARDLQAAFPGMTGFSPRNVWRMRSFYLAYTEDVRNLPRAVAEITWGHNADLLDMIKDEAAVKAAFSQECSNGRVERQVNRRKPLKRQMYGRAGFDLLRCRFLQAG